LASIEDQVFFSSLKLAIKLGQKCHKLAETFFCGDKPAETYQGKSQEPYPWLEEILGVAVVVLVLFTVDCLDWWHGNGMMHHA
jgi:hypothetical protein